MTELWSEPVDFLKEMDRRAEFRLLKGYARLMAAAMDVVVERERLRRARARLKKTHKRGPGSGVQARRVVQSTVRRGRPGS